MSNLLTAKRTLAFIALGLATGFFSGVFGIGGGILIVPILVMLGYGIKEASAISLGAVFLIALVGTATYAVLGQINWLLVALLAVGAVVGAQLGSRVVGRFPARVLQFIFAGFLVLVAISLFFVVPVRDAAVSLTLVTGCIAVLAGTVVGILAAILGIGGGVMIVPMLMLGFGVGDLVARGTAIAVMIPTAASGTIANLRAGRGNPRASLAIGGGAALSTPLGALAAAWLNPAIGNALFAMFLLFMAGQLAWRARRSA